jgi:hypothetical protein
MSTRSGRTYTGSNKPSTSKPTVKRNSQKAKKETPEQVLKRIAQMHWTDQSVILNSLKSITPKLVEKARMSLILENTPRAINTVTLADRGQLEVSNIIVRGITDGKTSQWIVDTIVTNYNAKIAGMCQRYPKLSPSERNEYLRKYFKAKYGNFQPASGTYGRLPKARHADAKAAIDGVRARTVEKFEHVSVKEVDKILTAVQTHFDYFFYMFSKRKFC